MTATEDKTGLAIPWSWHKILHEATGKITLLQRSGVLTAHDLEAMIEELTGIIFEMSQRKQELDHDQ